MREGARTSKHLFKNTIVAVSKLRVQAGNLRRSIWADLLQHLVNPFAEKLRPSGVTDFVKKHLAPQRKPNRKRADASGDVQALDLCFLCHRRDAEGESLVLRRREAAEQSCPPAPQAWL